MDIEIESAVEINPGEGRTRGRRILTRGRLSCLLVLTILMISAGLLIPALIRAAAERIAAEKFEVAAETLRERTGLVLRSDGIDVGRSLGISVVRPVILTPASEPFFTADTIIIDYSILDGRITGLELVSPRLYLRRLDDGRWEVEDFIPDEGNTHSRSGGEGRIDYPLPVRVSGGTVGIEDRSESSVVVPEISVDEASISLDLPGRSVAGDFSIEGAPGSLELSEEGDGVRIAVRASNLPLDAAGLYAPDYLSTSGARAEDLDLDLLISDDLLDLGGAIRLDGLVIDHHLLAPGPCGGLGGGFSGEVRLDRRDDEVTVSNGRVTLGGFEAGVDGSVSLDTEPVIDISVEFEGADLGELARNLPRSLIPHLPDLDAQGRITGRFSLFLDLSHPEGLDFSWEGTVEDFSIISLGPGIDPAALSEPFTHIVMTPDGETRAIRLDPAASSFISFGNIPRHLIGAVLTAEDGSFFRHSGFSERHIRDSIIENLRAGHVVRGASTITMQLAKNLYLTPRRTLTRKLEEAIITTALEERIEKRRMFEIYLNIIEWGPGIYGIGPASRYYFDHPAGDLTPVESAFLASIIARPRRHWGRNPLDNISAPWKEYLGVILVKMEEAGYISEEDLIETGLLPGGDLVPEEIPDRPAPPEIPVPKYP